MEALLTVLALCHTVHLEGQEKVGANDYSTTGMEYEYQASSPDEKALVEASRRLVNSEYLILYSLIYQDLFSLHPSLCNMYSVFKSSQFILQKGIKGSCTSAPTNKYIILHTQVSLGYCIGSKPYQKQYHFDFLYPRISSAHHLLDLSPL